MSDWCMNCLEAPSTTRRGGWDCCTECAAGADLKGIK